ncbi:MAG: ArnT family glycosyltransferase, partial [Candidatus Binatia bacterium]
MSALFETARAHLAARPALLPALVGSLALAIYLPAIGVGDFVGDDEALDAGVVQEMTRTGDWLFPEFNGEYLPPKPALFYWEAALAAKLHGRADEWSLRIPSAIAGAATVAITVAGTMRLAGPGPAAIAGLLLSVTRVMHGQSRIGRCDMTMTLWVSACLFLYAIADGPLPRSHRWLFYTFLGLVALSKGGAGVGLVGAVIVADTLATRRLDSVRSLLDPALLAFFVVGGSWYALGTWHWGDRFVDEQLIGENLNHLIGGAAVSDLGKGYRSVGYHLSYHGFYIFLVMLPWGFLLPLAMLEVWRSRRSPDAARLGFFAVWVLAGLFFFSLAARKSPYYLLPLAPPTAVLAAAWIFPRVKSTLGFVARPSLRLVAFAAAAAILAWSLPFAPLTGIREVPAVRTTFAEHPLIAITILAAIVGFGASAFIAARSRRPASTLLFVWSTTFAVLMLANLLQGPIDDLDSMKPFATEVRERTTERDRLYFF